MLFNSTVKTSSLAQQFLFLQCISGKQKTARRRLIARCLLLSCYIFTKGISCIILSFVSYVSVILISYAHTLMTQELTNISHWHTFHKRIIRKRIPLQLISLISHITQKSRTSQGSLSPCATGISAEYSSLGASWFLVKILAAMIESLTLVELESIRVL